MVPAKLVHKLLIPIKITLDLFLWPSLAMGNGSMTIQNLCKSYTSFCITDLTKLSNKLSMSKRSLIKNGFDARIRPGYIVMREAEYLEKKMENHYSRSIHFSLLEDFTGKNWT